ncbi:hypothetical protein PRIPAC_75075 [Pristionchus pacificus]|uniref:Uncharacterized protein n=1 Tax=Pristionchus pacificus TaxID=54126 RepID=A0A2A6C544_PRIPA|nr:hypothetical protein PRIPAC_75075 [Pristionchus pacificus]|eukprot:PDM73259.1 hypothetical protein PRIPAC_40615 [Pristionchus pacificus]
MNLLSVSGKAFGVRESDSALFWNSKPQTFINVATANLFRGKYISEFLFCGYGSNKDFTPWVFFVENVVASRIFLSVNTINKENFGAVLQIANVAKQMDIYVSKLTISRIATITLIEEIFHRRCEQLFFRCDEFFMADEEMEKFVQLTHHLEKTNWFYTTNVYSNPVRVGAYIVMLSYRGTYIIHI